MALHAATCRDRHAIDECVTAKKYLLAQRSSDAELPDSRMDEVHELAHGPRPMAAKLGQQPFRLQPGQCGRGTDERIVGAPASLACLRHYVRPHRAEHHVARQLQQVRVGRVEQSLSRDRLELRMVQAQRPERGAATQRQCVPQQMLRLSSGEKPLPR